MYYDDMGNITSRTDVANNAAWTYDPTRKHEVTEAGSTAYEYAYDPNGNMTSRSGSSIAWTSYNYPSTINDSATGESVSFSYGPDRNSWAETTQEPSGPTTRYRLGSLMDIVVTGAGSTDRDYIYAGNDPVAVDVPGTGASGFHYFQTDQQGSISAITDGTGLVAVSESFTAYGTRRNPSTWSGSPTSAQLTTIAGITQHGYTFQRTLGEQMGLNDMVGRVQDAVIGRFISADPYVTEQENTQDWNPYSYVYNNPLSHIDPTGYSCQFFLGNDLWKQAIYYGSQLLGISFFSEGGPASGSACSDGGGGDRGYGDIGGGAGGNGNNAGGKGASKTARYEQQQTTHTCSAGPSKQIGISYSGNLFGVLGGATLSFTFGVSLPQSGFGVQLFLGAEFDPMIGLGLNAGTGIGPTFGNAPGPIESGLSANSTGFHTETGAGLAYGGSLGQTALPDGTKSTAVGVSGPPLPALPIITGLVVAFLAIGAGNAWLRRRLRRLPSDAWADFDTESDRRIVFWQKRITLLVCEAVVPVLAGIVTFWVV